MNSEPSPLVPQGQLLDPKTKGRARLKNTVFCVLAIHGIILVAALLMQGCRREEPVTVPPPDVDTNAIVAPMLDDTTAPPTDTNAYVAPTMTDTNLPVVDTYVAPPTNTYVAPLGTSDHKVAKGDTYSSLAKKYNVTVRAITEANPGVNPARLQIGQTLHIPAASATPDTSVAPVNAPSSDEKVYTVRSGDNLTKIANNHGVTIKALRSANNLSTDQIKVGQKLKIPAKSPAR